MTTALIGTRLKALREQTAMTQGEVAARLGFKDRQTVSAIETGERQVKAEELVQLIDIFGVDLDYFTNPFRLVGEGSFSWRQDGLTIAQLQDYEQKAGSLLAIYRHYAPRVGRKTLLCRPKLPLSKRSTFEDAIAAGESVWEDLRLGDVPAASLARAMEDRYGILVLMVDAIEGVSGAACRLPELDAVLVNRNEIAGRRHFDLAHELFHIMTWEEMPPDYSEDAVGFTKKRSRVEQLADNFAAALLMPATVISRFGEWAHLAGAGLVSRLNEVADELQVTAKALKWRLLTLRQLTDKIIKTLDDGMLRNNGRSHLEDAVPAMFSTPFVRVIGKAIDEGLISSRRAAQELGLNKQGLSALMHEHAVTVDGL